MDDFKKGITEAFTGIVARYIVVTFIDSLAKDGLLPWYFQGSFALISIVGSLGVIGLFDSVGIFYIVGWVIGSWLFKDLLGAVGVIFNIVVPVVIIVLRVWFMFKK